MMFNEKKIEYDQASKTNIPVSQTAKYITSKNAAIKLIEEKEFISESDFWILMNRSNSGDKMFYSGLIISHNGCLKINDNLPKEQKFKPECVRVNENGYNGALVFTYICPEQGIYEVGEVSPQNCKNNYPYAMALKRCFDRVVLKQCKLAFYGVYSDSEADEFKEDPSRVSNSEGFKLKEKERKAEEEKNADLLNKDFQKNMDTIPMSTKKQVNEIRDLLIALGQDEDKFLKAKKISCLEEIPEKVAEQMIIKMKQRLEE